MYGIKQISIEQTIARLVLRYLARVAGNHIPKPGHCQCCGHAGALRWHGSYERSLITLARTYALPIKRLFCTFCGQAFAVLPDFVLKFHRYAKPVILHAVRMLGSHTYETVAGMFMGQAEHPLAILTLHLWHRRFA
ncbi:MAG: DUF6431 domain-containing protein [Pseudomonadota bacterium]